jgi:hypothetical protein
VDCWLLSRTAPEIASRGSMPTESGDREIEAAGQLQWKLSGFNLHN